MNSIQSLQAQIIKNPYMPTHYIYETLDSSQRVELINFLCNMIWDKNLIFHKFMEAHGYIESTFLANHIQSRGIALLKRNRGHIFSIMKAKQILLPHIIFFSDNLKNICVILQEPLDISNQTELQEKINRHYPKCGVSLYICTQKFLHEINFCLTIKHQLDKGDLHEDLIVNLISLCVIYNVSDIHITLQEKIGSLCLRIEGNLLHIINLNENLFYKLTQKIKLLCHLDITEKKIPQDGHFSIQGLFNTELFKNLYKCIEDSSNILFPHQKNCDIRVSCFPALDGESVVLRIPNYSQRFLSLDSLNLQQHITESLKKHLITKSGLILVSGTTGSGKSTLLYNCIRFLNDGTRKIITIEDPVEQHIKGITQCQVSENLSFSMALKHILRQDPDVIMIGEIRDSATMDSALRAALTGHLVLASIHSHDCLSSIARLKDLGAKQYLLESTISCIISQRLLKTFCQKCKVEGKSISKGCMHCYYQGFGKRILIQEIIDSEIMQDFLRGNLLHQDSKHGFISLKQQAKELFEQGKICYEESLI
ncbi:general secretion pathway protein GspE [Helicobacter muridarum]|uniref:General secretion pathway protein GspE n=1 Tax=Helicobacter muridarum TaxID=216 RepID=A0A099U0D8_9HELI|nr:ATPase, T2SS/T4P/T4SS family [Helicobacter muridarum]TLE00225.1 general secretion pathway protein GspE [Helicobacter muridarum]STQ85714.1 type II protein secretion system E protein [Helicobacter muridarum]